MDENNLRKLIKCNRNKETRWDRIRKKHIHSVNVTTENVKKFFGMNFINENQLRILNGESKRRFYLNPALVMHMRHEMIRRNSKHITEHHHHCNPLKSLQIEKIRDHNNTIETRYLHHQLAKFENEIASNRKRLSTVQHHWTDLFSYEPLDDSKLLSSFSNGHECIQEFYKDRRQASLVENQIFGNCIESTEDNVSDMERPRDDNLVKTNIDDDRCARFGDVAEVINLENEEIIDIQNISDRQSDTSSEHIQTESVLEVKLVPKQLVVTDTTLELVGKHMRHMVERSVPTMLDENLKLEEEPVQQSHKSPDKGSVDSDKNPFVITKMNVINHHQLENSQSSIVGIKTEIQPEQDAIISDLFIQDTQSNDVRRKALQKYFLRWMHFTTVERISKENVSCQQTRIQKIETFLNTIRMEKKKHTRTGQPVVEIKKKNSDLENPVVLARKYHTKLKIQQDIIELQKLKLERQERMITELKLSKISDDAKESKAQIKDELKNVIRNGCANSRAKARCLQIVANVKVDDDDEYAKLQARGVPKFLIEMEARAMERNRKHKEAKERREQLDKEKEELRIAAEEAKRLQDEETKRKRIDELREKRRQEKLLKIQKENERLKQIENNTKANAFYRHMLLSRLGMSCFKILIKIKKRNEYRSDVFRKTLIAKNVFHLWKLHVYNIWNHRKNKANNHFNQQLVKKSIAAWKKYQLMQHSKLLVAIDWCDMKLTERMFRIWIGMTKMQKILDEIKMRQAESHYNWHLKWRVIDHWQRLQTILKIEKETEERRQRWRMKIWELLPDYTPNRNY